MNARDGEQPQPITVEGFQFGEPVLIDGGRKATIVFDLNRPRGMVAVQVPGAQQVLVRESCDVEPDYNRMFDPAASLDSWKLGDPYVAAALWGMKIADPDQPDGVRLQKVARACAEHLVERATHRPALDDLVAQIMPTEDELAAALDRAAGDFETACSIVRQAVFDRGIGLFVIADS